MKRISKEKASSTDKIMDIIFDKKYYTNIKINGSYIEIYDRMDTMLVKQWNETVQWKLATALTAYYNERMMKNEKLTN